MEEDPVGSAWELPWLIVTVGTTVSYVITLSVEVEASFRFPAASCATPEGIVAMTVPLAVIPEIETV